MANVFASLRWVSAYIITNALQITNRPKLNPMYEYTKLRGFFSLVLVIIIKASEFMANKSDTITIKGNEATRNLEKTKYSIPYKAIEISAN